MIKKLCVWGTILGAILLVNACEQQEEVLSPVTTQDNATLTDYVVQLADNNANEIQGTYNKDAYVNEFIAAQGIDEEKVYNKYHTVITGFAASLTETQVAELRLNSKVLIVEEDLEFVLDNQVEPEEKGNKTLSQTTPWGIQTTGTMDADANTGLAWILDTGIDLDHPDLNVNTSLCSTFVRRGRDAYTADDYNGHGTHCAGIVGAENNNIGVIGVCAGAEVIAVKVLDYRGRGYLSDIIRGLDYIGDTMDDNETNAVNISLGGGRSTTLDNAVRSLADDGAYISIAAGNSRRDASYYSPARVNAERVYTISAMTSYGSLAYFSNYGSPVDYAAPGYYIYSTYKYGRYRSMSGTSMAAPHVTGILLANDGEINTDGTITRDRDNDPDPIAVID